MRALIVLALLFCTQVANANIAVINDSCTGSGATTYGSVPYINKTLASQILRTYFSFDNEQDRTKHLRTFGKITSLIYAHKAAGNDIDEGALARIASPYVNELDNGPKGIRWQDRDIAINKWLNQRDKSHGYQTNQLFIDSFHHPKEVTAQCTLFLYIYDEIKPEDVKTLESILAQFSNPPFLHITLNSPGGNLEAGIQLGRIVRKHYGIVNVHSENVNTALQALVAMDGKATITEPCESCGDLVRHIKEGRARATNPSGEMNLESGVCYSACVLVYAGGISRVAMFTGEIGVHQHFLKKDYLKTLTVEEGVKELQRATKLVSTYFADIGINPELLQVALSVNKDKIRILDLCELQLLLPFAVAEYANIIPQKEEEQLKLLGDITYMYMYESLGNAKTPTEIINYAYTSLKRDMPNIKWNSFFGYGLSNGIQQQEKDWTILECGNL
jgi:hypothetical protein